MKDNRKTAIITGASRGLGYVLAESLAKKGWNLIINGRNPEKLLQAKKKLSKITEVIAISGDVRDEVHLLQFPEYIERFGRLDLVVNNASTIGASPQPPLMEYRLETLHNIFHTNALAPLSLLQKVKAYLKPGAIIINLSSDAAVEAYEGWGGYGASKAAVDHWSATLAKENPQWKVYWVDPGDMRTQMHQEAFPEEDISDRPLPEASVPGFLKLIEGVLPSGRYRSQEMGKSTLLTASDHLAH